MVEKAISIICFEETAASKKIIEVHNDALIILLLDTCSLDGAVRLTHYAAPVLSVSGDGPPSDVMTIISKFEYVTKFLYGILSALSMAGIVLAVGFLIMNVVHRKKR